MTIQVGMLGSDGVLLASDTKIWAEPPGMKHTVTAGLSKIKLSRDQKVAVSCAQDLPSAYRVADAIIKNLTSEFWSAPENDIRGIALAELDFRDAGNECLIVLAEPYPSLFIFSSGLREKDGGWPNAYCSRIPTYAFLGHKTNTATFFADRFFRPTPPRMRSLEELKTLASQAITEAGRLNSGSVGGLEMLTCDTTGIRVLSPQESITLEAEAYERSQRIEALIFPE